MSNNNHINHNNYPGPVEKIVSDYLERLAKHLKGLPQKNKEEFVKEMQSHIYESYMNDTTEDEIDRILNVLKKLGEPSELFSKKMPNALVKMGKDKKMPLYILSGILIGLFGIPLGIGGVAVLISIIGTVFSLIIAYFATAISLVVAGFAGLVISIVRIVDPGFLEQFFDISGIEGISRYFSSPLAEGIIGIFVSVIIAGIGILLLFLGKYILRGLRFSTNLIIDKVKNFRKKR